MERTSMLGRRRRGGVSEERLKDCDDTMSASLGPTLRLPKDCEDTTSATPPAPAAMAVAVGASSCGCGPTLTKLPVRLTGVKLPGLPGMLCRRMLAARESVKSALVEGSDELRRLSTGVFHSPMVSLTG